MRKGSLNLSINAIVVLILAITMLGLGLGFMKNTFKGVTGQFETVTDEMHKEMIDRLAEGAKRVDLNVYEIEIKQSDKKTVYLAIADQLAETGSSMRYDIGSTITPVGSASCPELQTLNSITISAGDAKVLPVFIETTSGEQGTCRYEIVVTAGGAEYASEDFYITIK